MKKKRKRPYSAIKFLYFSCSSFIVVICCRYVLTKSKKTEYCGIKRRFENVVFYFMLSRCSNKSKEDFNNCSFIWSVIWKTLSFLYIEKCLILTVSCDGLKQKSACNFHSWSDKLLRISFLNRTCHGESRDYVYKKERKLLKKMNANLYYNG